jgi:hypothetical protein
MGFWQKNKRMLVCTRKCPTRHTPISPCRILNANVRSYPEQLNPYDSLNICDNGWVIMSEFIELCLCLKHAWHFVTSFYLRLLWLVVIPTINIEVYQNTDNQSLEGVMTDNVRNTCLLNTPKTMNYVRHNIGIMNSLYWHVSTKTQEPSVLFSAFAWSVGSYITETIILLLKQKCLYPISIAPRFSSLWSGYVVVREPIGTFQFRHPLCMPFPGVKLNNWMYISLTIFMTI